MDVPEADRPHMSVMIGAQYWAARAGTNSRYVAILTDA